MSKRGRGNNSDAVNRDLLHQYLFAKADRHQMVTISTGVLADELGVTIYCMSRILKEMKETGRIRKIGLRYEVTDPDIYMWTKTHRNT